MAISSRSASRGTEKRRKVTSAPPASAASPSHHHHNNKQNTANSAVAPATTLANGDGDDGSDAPPAKRRKLSIRPASTTHHTHHAPHSQQTTLDSHFLKPPNTRVSLREPHGQLIQTINGVSTELDAAEDDLLKPSPKPRRRTRSPQPAPPPTQQDQKQEDKRTLRSQDDGPRLKSELAIYFPAYEDIMFDAPKEEEWLSQDTALYITDDTAKTAATSQTNTPAKPGKSAAHGRRPSTATNGPPILTPQRTSSSHFNGSPSLNFDFVAKTIPDDAEDPLTDAHFLKSHKRAERKEKQLRNIEKERAQHEKVQLERILDGLQGHDWLKVLGITGVTDTEAKKYEPKRKYFIDEVKALVDKFRQWKDQEKKQRADREAAYAAREVDEDGNTTEGSVEPPSSDLNAHAARQLHHEMTSTSAKPSAKGKERAHNHHFPTSHPATPSAVASPKPTLPPAPPSPEVPITSFYSKRHIRDAAISRSRHGRNVTAFGQPLPEMDEQEFELPDEYVTEDALRSNARERRRRKRGTANDSKTS